MDIRQLSALFEIGDHPLSLAGVEEMAADDYAVGRRLLYVTELTWCRAGNVINISYVPFTL